MWEVVCMHQSPTTGVKACRKIQTSVLKGTALFSTCRYDRHRMCQFSRLHFQAGWNLKALNVLMGEQSPGTHLGYQKGMHYIMQSHSKIMCVPYQGSGHETIMLTRAYLMPCSFWVYSIWVYGRVGTKWEAWYTCMLNVSSTAAGDFA